MKALIIASLLLSVSCANTTTPSGSGSSLSSVAIPQSSVKDQGAVGFCWAYATAAFIEAETLRKTGRTIDISEEQIALYRMAAEIASDLRSGTDVTDIQDKVMQSEYEGWFVRLPDRWDAEATDSMELVDMFGVLEEREWGVKFPAVSFPFEPMANGGYKQELSRLVGLLDAKSSDADVIKAVASSFGRDVPPTGHKIAIKSKDYISYWAESATDMPDIIQRAKAELAKGITVPMSYGVTFAKLNQRTFMWAGGKDRKVETYTRMSSYEARYGYAADGGHAVLMTDFVNDGGAEGRINDSALASAIAAPFDTLNYVVFKNSWGTDNGMPPGYYRLDTSYMLGSAQAGIFDIVVKR